MGAPIRSTPNMLKLRYASRMRHTDVQRLKNKITSGMSTALCLKENAFTTQQKGSGTFILKLMQLGGLYQPYKQRRTRGPLCFDARKIQGVSCKSDHLCCFFFRALKQKHLQGGCPFYSNKIVKKSRCLHMLHMFSYKTIAYRNCFNIVQCHIQRTIFVIQGQRKNSLPGRDVTPLRC